MVQYHTNNEKAYHSFLSDGIKYSRINKVMPANSAAQWERLIRTKAEIISKPRYKTAAQRAEAR